MQHRFFLHLGENVHLCLKPILQFLELAAQPAQLCSDGMKNNQEWKCSIHYQDIYETCIYCRYDKFTIA